MIVPRDRPLWLTRLLEFYGREIADEIKEQAKLPSKASTLQKLKDTHRCAKQLSEFLDDAPIMIFTESEGGVEINAAELQAGLKAFAGPVRTAFEAGAIASAKGRAKRRGGRAMAHIWPLPKEYCAAVIAESWLFVRGQRPVPHDRKAGAAANIFWLACGGARGWGSDPRTGLVQVFQVGELTPDEKHTG
jgi:hypothetical protein